jgi:multidrug efflux pump subunit AcrA (membrane-fusion protein)
MGAGNQLPCDTLFSPRFLNQNLSLEGPMILAAPSWSGILTLSAAFTVILILIILFQGSYASRLAVGGYLSRASNVLDITATRGGRLGQIHVAPHTPVKRGQPLFELLSQDQSTSAANLLDQKLQSLESRRLLLQQQHQAEELGRKLERENAGLDSARLENRMQYFLQRSALLHEQLDQRMKQDLDLEALMEKGYLAPRDLTSSREQTLQLRLSVLENQQEIFLLRHQQEELLRSLSIKDARWRASDLGFRAQQGQLAEQEMELQQEMARTILAPVDAMVGDIHANPGTQLNATQAVMSLFQSQDRLSAELAIPARLLPAVTENLMVRIMLDDSLDAAQTSLSGTIVSVSPTPLPAGSRMGPLILREASFRALVALEGPGADQAGWRSANAHRVISAQLIGQPRTLIQWLLKPLKQRQLTVS